MNNRIPAPFGVKRRFQLEHSDSLSQAEFILTDRDEWVTSFFDDPSRFASEARIRHSPTAEHWIKLLEKSMRRYGKPEQILTDRGSQFYPAR